jgi:flagellum-specific ATP synthase
VPGSDPAIDEAIRLWPKLDAFVAKPSPEGVAASFARLAEALGVGV